MQLGALGGLIGTSPGTLGVLVKYPPPRTEVYLLSCSHVIANCGQFDDFDGMYWGYKVVQQPLSGPPAGPNRIGLLQNVFSVIQPRATVDSDVALALVDDPVVAATSPYQAAGDPPITIQGLNPDHPSSWQANMTTQLLGAMSPEVRRGTIIGYNGDSPESIKYEGSWQANVTGLVRYQTASLPGDSGGAVLDEQNRLLGIHVGVSEAGYPVFFPVGPCLRKRGMDVWIGNI